jgi:ribosomal protein L37E
MVSLPNDLKRKGALMALIACPECGRRGISDQAVACPACAYPLGAHAREPVGRGGQPQPVATVEQTGKRWKTMKLYAVLLLIAGAILFGGGASSDSGVATAFGGLALFGSLVLGIIASVGAWWHHK